MTQNLTYNATHWPNLCRNKRSFISQFPCLLQKIEDLGANKQGIFPLILGNRAEPTNCKEFCIGTLCF